MAILAETQDVLCALPSTKRRTLAMTLYIRVGAHMHGHAHCGHRSTMELTRSSN